MTESLSLKAHLEQQGIVLKAHSTEPAEYKRLVPNRYTARLVNITKHAGPYGTSLKITFEIPQGSDCVRLITFASLSLFVGSENRPPSKLSQLFYAVKKRMPEPEEEVDLLTLPGLSCYVIVSDVPGKTYQAIKDFQPLEDTSTEIFA